MTFLTTEIKARLAGNGRLGAKISEYIPTLQGGGGGGGGFTYCKNDHSFHGNPRIDLYLFAQGAWGEGGSQNGPRYQLPGESHPPLETGFFGSVRGQYNWVWDLSSGSIAAKGGSLSVAGGYRLGNVSAFGSWTF